MLCTICQQAVHSLWNTHPNVAIDHHSSWASLSASAAEGCSICLDVEELVVEKDIEHLREPALVLPEALTCIGKYQRDTYESEPWGIYVSSKLILATSDIPESPGNREFVILGYSIVPAAATDSAEGTERHNPATKLEDSTGSSQTFSFITGWLDTCINTHESCNAYHDDSWVPSRLLELRGFSEWDTKVYLRTQFPDEQPRYLTLSHRWGSAESQQLKLTARSLHAFLDGINVFDLPRTFQDMTEIVRRLGFRYLWIDCMCIFQDDAEDWRRESALMGKIYTNSWLNISAAAAEESSHGCFTQRNPSQVLSYIDGPPHDSHGSTIWMLMPHDMWTDEVEAAPLNRRGWVLQERILSPRVIHFAKKQVYWECRQTRACESFADDGPPDVVDLNDYHQMKYLVPGRALKDYGDQSGYMEFSYWHSVVQKYALSGLTFDTDRLIALSGIAHEVNKVLGPDYLAGLWSKDLPYNLSWYFFYAGKKSTGGGKVYVAPSWSWASVSSHSLLEIPDGQYHQRIAHMYIKKAVIIPTSDRDPFGQVADGFITARAKLGHATWAVPADSVPIDTDITVSATQGFSNSDKYAGSYEPGALVRTTARSVNIMIDDHEQIGLQEAFFVPVYTQISSESAETSGYKLRALLLSRLPCGRFARVGVALFYSEEAELLASLFEQDVTII